MSPLEFHAIYALAWCSFGYGHSLLATTKAKGLLIPALGPYYRITYNAAAGIHIFAVWLIGAWLFEGVSEFVLSTPIRAGLHGLSILGLVILVLALRGYDLGLLAGTAQIRNHRQGLGEPGIEPFHTTGFHAYVRHPIYSGAFLMLWGNCQDEFGLATAIWGSTYLTIGAMHEELFLQSLYGKAYQTYRSTVPAFFPWRGKVVNTSEETA